MPAGCTAALMQTHSKSRGLLEPQVILDPLETPAPAPGLNGELYYGFHLLFPGVWRTPRAIAHQLHKSLLSHT